MNTDLHLKLMGQLISAFLIMLISTKTKKKAFLPSEYENENRLLMESK